MSELRVLHPVRPESVMTKKFPQMTTLSHLYQQNRPAKLVLDRVVLAMSQKVDTKNNIDAVLQTLGDKAGEFLKDLVEAVEYAILHISAHPDPGARMEVAWNTIVGIVFYPSLPMQVWQKLSANNLLVYLEQYPTLFQLFEADLAASTASVKPEPKAPVQAETPAPAVVSKKKAKKGKKPVAARKEVVIDDAPQPPAGAHKQRDPQFLVVLPEGSAGETAMAEAFRQATQRAS